MRPPSSFPARPCSFPRACAARPLAQHLTQTLFDSSPRPPFYAGRAKGTNNAAAEVAREAARNAEREALVARLVAELMRNSIEPLSTGPGANVALLEGQIAEGKSAAATSGATWL